MQLRYSQMLAAMRQGTQFFDANGVALGDFNTGGTRKAYDAVTAQLGVLAERQEALEFKARGELSKEKELARALRRQHIVPIVRVARALVPDVARLAPVRVPPFKSNNTDLTSRARALGDAVEAHAEQLKAGGLADNFVAALRAASDALDAAIVTKGVHRRERIGATEGIVDVVRRARRATAAADGLVRARLGAREPLVTEWQTVARKIRVTARQAIRAVTESTSTSNPPVVEAPSTKAA